MPLTPRGKKIMKSMKEQYGKKKGEQVFYATKNKGKLKGVEKAYLGKAVRQPTETKKEFEMRHAYHKPFMKKLKVIKASKGRDAGMGMGGKTGNYGGGSKSSGGGGRDLDFQQRGMSKADYAKSTQTQNFGGRQSKIGPVVKDVPFKPPLSTAQSLAVGLVVPFLGTGINFAAKQQYKSRQKFSKKEGLYRDVYKTTGKVLQPNAPVGKDYLKAAGFGKRPEMKQDQDRDGPPILPPVIPVSTTKPVDENLVKPKDNFFNFVAYKVGGLSGGVKYGPPPKRGPNSQVPPVKMKKGGYKK
jgi:hypothetical protein